MAEKPAVIILHGWGLSGSVYDPLKKLLENAGFLVFAPDLPGFGQTKPPDTIWGLTEYVKYLHEYLKKKSLNQVIFVGHSFGGRIALKYSYYHPAQVKGIILTGTPGFSPVRGSRRFIIRWVAKLGKAAVSVVPIKAYRELFQRLFYYAVGVRDFYRAEGIMKDVFKVVVEESLDGSMKTVRCPCLLIWGENDLIVPVRVAKKMASTINKSQLIIVPGTDHSIPILNSEKIFPELIRFIDRL